MEQKIKFYNAKISNVVCLRVGKMINKRQTGTQTYFCSFDWTYVPWYARLLGLIRLPYDIVRFVVIGKFIGIPWPWRW